MEQLKKQYTEKKLKCEKMIKQHKESTNEHNPNWQQIPDYLYRQLIIGSSRSG